MYLNYLGECTRGDSCRFSHSAEGGDASGFMPRRSGGNVCYAFQKGKLKLFYI